MSSLPTRRVVGAVAATLIAPLVALVAVAGLSSPAHAEEGYRYWNYFHLEDGSWTFSMKGTAQYVPPDGSVEGFRYGASAASDTDGVPPRADLDEVTFDAVCDGTAAGDAEKRVAVVLDYGTESDADGETPPEPQAECAVVDESAKTSAVLDAVSDIRVENGMTCAIDGYPVEGCGVPVSDVPAASDEQSVAFTMPSADDADTAAEDEDGGLVWPLVGVVGVAALIGVAALTLSRRNKSA